MKKFTKTIISILGCALLIPAMTGCSSQGNAESEPVAVSVETKTMTAESVSQYKNISSTVMASNEIAIIPKVGGTVNKVHVNLGDRVSEGDVLFEIDGSTLSLQVDSAQAAANSTATGLESQISQLKSTISNLELQYDELVKNQARLEALYEAEAVSLQEVENIRLSVETTKKQLDQTRESLALTEKKNVSDLSQTQTGVKTAQQQLDYTKVKAEISGLISACSVTEGSTVSSQSALITIVDMDTVKITFNVSENYINQVKEGAIVYTTISSVSDAPFEGKVAYVAPAANSVSMLYPVEVYIANPDHAIKPGMFASLKLVLDEKENTLSLPLNAVLEKGGEKFVFVIDEDNLARKAIVQTGVKNDETVEIVSGLNFGDQVVITGQDFITDETLVKVINNY